LPTAGRNELKKNLLLLFEKTPGKGRGQTVMVKGKTGRGDVPWRQKRLRTHTDQTWEIIRKKTLGPSYSSRRRTSGWGKEERVERGQEGATPTVTKQQSRCRIGKEGGKVLDGERKRKGGGGLEKRP